MIAMTYDPIDRADPDTDRQVGKVVVVGAGMAGLAAAAELRHHGVEVRVLEARHRIGGRIWTSNLWPDVPVDLGACWIHGADGNPLTDLAQDLGAPHMVTSYDNRIFFDVDGRPLSPAGEHLMDEVEEHLEKLAAEPIDCGPGSSMLDALHLKWNPDLLPDDRRRWLLAAANDTEHLYGADLGDLDSQTGFDSDDAVSGPDLFLPSGYGALIDGLATGLSITTDCTVQTVRVSSTRVILETTQGEIEADRVLITLPLGVLQSEQVTFDPPLPERKVEAIQRLGSGLLNKCCLRFPDVFWHEGYELIGHVDDRPGRWLEFLNLYAYTEQPVLIALNGGSFARELESWSDPDTVDGAMEVLKGIYGNAIPLPESVQISRWAADPFALGAYSYNAVGSGPADRRALAEPAFNRLFFAGEATMASGYQTVHGALKSGFREARRLLEGTT